MITQEKLKEILHYNPDTGIFTWLKHRDPKKIATNAGAESSHGYLYVSIQGRQYYLHRLAFLYQRGSFPKHLCDHVDGNRKNNRWFNLRMATHSQNIQNASAKSKNATGVRGVYPANKGKSFIARIDVNHKQINLGCYPSIEEAQAAYIAAKKELHLFNTIGEKDNYGNNATR